MLDRGVHDRTPSLYKLGRELASSHESQTVTRINNLDTGRIAHVSILCIVQILRTGTISKEVSWSFMVTVAVLLYALIPSPSLTSSRSLEVTNFENK